LLARAAGPSQNVVGNSNRLVFILFAFFFFTLIFFGRLVYLQIIVADDYSAKAREARTTPGTPGRRGTIYDRSGILLATSVDATTIFANPREITDVDGTAAQIAYILGGEYEDYKKRLSQEGTEFVYILRQADSELADELKALKLKGVYFTPDTKRVYPKGQIGGQVIGFADIDGRGVSGLELFYDEVLKGLPGKPSERGRSGIPIPSEVNVDTLPTNGQDIVISIDYVLQEYLEARLLKVIADTEGSGGVAMVMDAATGEIYACASFPLFNPADTSVVEEGATEMKGITEAFEPGSILKTATMLAVLESGTLKAGDSLFCPAYLVADEYYVSDASYRGDETMTLTEILARSSNVGISMSAEKLGFPKLYQYLLDYQLNVATGVDYPGESKGFLSNSNQWSLVQSYNVSFGQGIMVTPLQMLSFYGALANDGVACSPHFLINMPQGEEALSYPSVKIVKSQSALSDLLGMLETVVVSGTASDIYLEGYRVAGKTGTAEYASLEGGYEEGLYNVSFIGFLPDSGSQLVCFVGVNEVPGDRKVTKAFQDIMEFAIERYKIAPSEG